MSVPLSRASRGVCAQSWCSEAGRAQGCPRPCSGRLAPLDPLTPHGIPSGAPQRPKEACRRCIQALTAWPFPEPIQPARWAGEDTGPRPTRPPIPSPPIPPDACPPAPWVPAADCSLEKQKTHALGHTLAHEGTAHLSCPPWKGLLSKPASGCSRPSICLCRPGGTRPLMCAGGSCVHSRGRHAGAASHQADSDP